MNIKNMLLVLGSVAALSSCSTAYRSGQTPDDVYYSPGRQQQGQDEYVDVQRQQGRYDDGSAANSRYNDYDAYDNYRDDRFLRMSMGSPLRLGYFNDYQMYNGYMGYNSWKYNNMYNLGFNSPMNGFYFWNSFYNPYSAYDYYSPGFGYGGLYGGGFGGYLPGSYVPGVIVPGKSPSVNPISRPRAFNPGSYAANNSFSNTSRYIDRPATTPSSSSRNSYVNPAGRYNNRNSGSGLGNTMRRIVNGSSDDSYYNNGRSSNSSNNRNSGATENTYTPPARTYEAPTRTYTPSPSSSGSGNSGSSSSGGGISRPPRGGR